MIKKLKEFWRKIYYRPFMDTVLWTLEQDPPLVSASVKERIDYEYFYLSGNDVCILIMGHADESEGTREYCLGISQRRAELHRDLLIARGVAAHRIEVFAYGKGRPWSLTDASLNARTEVSERG